jgi:NADH-quinone oxidoreductase subunit J
MTHNQIIVAIGTLLLASSLWLMLPRGSAAARKLAPALGAVLLLVALGVFASLGWRLASWRAEAVFWVLAGVTLVSAAAAVTFRSPVYCAIWFALSLLGTAALLLCLGAQFLAVATIVVYAGAILVTFLFVLMLAQSTGRAYYDRISWEPLVAAVTGGVLVGILTMALLGANVPQGGALPGDELKANIRSRDHVAHLGAELFSRYLIGVEVAGTLVLVALGGAIAIVSHEPAPRTSGPDLRDESSRSKEPSHG